MGLDEKQQLMGNFEKILKFFGENSIEKLTLFIFYFFYFFENLLLKVEPSEITPFFYNNFFAFWGDFPPLPPGYALTPTMLPVSSISEILDILLES